jgi:ribosomal protein L7/L12
MLTLILLTFIQPQEPPKAEAKPSIVRILPKLKDLKPEQQAELKKLSEEYAALIADLEKERDSKLAAVLSKEQRDEVARLVAEEMDRYRVVLREKMRRPQDLFKAMKDVLNLDPPAAKQRIDQTPAKPLAEDLTKAKADALLKAITAAKAKAVIEKQEDK